MIVPLAGKTPIVGEGCFIAPSADLIGEVKLGRRCSVWFNATVRGDVMPIVIGDETNIQDNAVIHGTYKKAAAVIGRRVTVGHSVILHGCTVGDRCLIGMGAIIMDHAEIGPRCIVGAGALVTESAKFEEGQLVLGRPAKAVRPLKPEELAFLDRSADNYIEYMGWYSGLGRN